MSVLNEYFSAEDFKKCKHVYRDIISSLVSLNQNNLVNMETVTAWMENVIHGNVNNNRTDRRFGLITSTVKTLLETVSSETLELAYALDWTMEFFHGTNTICENIMENKSHSAWHSLEKVGMMAVNDAIILRACTYNILKVYFDNKFSFYTKLEDLRRNVCDQYHLGRGLYETLKKDTTLLETFSMDVYREIVNLRVGYTTCYIPVMMAFTLVEKQVNLETQKLLREILLDIGYYQEIQQDYAKIFDKDENQEISEGDLKLNWFFVKTLENLREKGTDYWILQEHVEAKSLSELKQIYKENRILHDFLAEKNSLKDKIAANICNLQKTTRVEDSFVNFLNFLIK